MKKIKKKLYIKSRRAKPLQWKYNFVECNNDNFYCYNKLEFTRIAMN